MNDTLTELVLATQAAAQAAGVPSLTRLVVEAVGVGVPIDLAGEFNPDTQRVVTLVRQFDNFNVQAIAQALAADILSDVRSLNAQGMRIDRYGLFIHEAPTQRDWRAIRYSKCVQIIPH